MKCDLSKCKHVDDLERELAAARCALKEAVVHVNTWMPEDNLPHPDQLRKWVRIANISIREIEEQANAELHSSERSAAERR